MWCVCRNANLRLNNFYSNSDNIHGIAIEIFKQTLTKEMFTICVSLYEDMTKRCQNIIYLGSHFGKTEVNV